MKLCCKCGERERMVSRSGNVLTMCECCQREYWRTMKDGGEPARKRSENTEHEIATMIYRAKRHGLNDGQMAVWRALDRLSLLSAQSPSLMEIAREAGVSRAMVWWTIPVLEALEYVHVNRGRNGRMRNRGLVLMVGLDDVEMEEDG